MQGWRHWTKAIGASSLVSAVAALAIPGPAGEITGVASVLAVGAIAILAEHAWGLLLVAIAEVLLVGKVWPALAFSSPEGLGPMVAGIALVAALPGLYLFVRTLPRTIEMVLGAGQTRLHRASVTAAALSALVWVALPAVLDASEPAPAPSSSSDLAKASAPRGRDSAQRQLDRATAVAGDRDPQLASAGLSDHGDPGAVLAGDRGELVGALPRAADDKTAGAFAEQELIDATAFVAQLDLGADTAGDRALADCDGEPTVADVVSTADYASPDQLQNGAVAGEMTVEIEACRHTGAQAGDPVQVLGPTQ